MAKKKKTEQDYIKELHKKEMPNSIEAEKEVLGAVLIDEESLPKALEILKPEHFYNPKHRKIFTAIKNLFENSEPVNVMTVYHELEKMEDDEDKNKIIIGAAYLNELTTSVVSAVNVAYNARVVLEKWVLRKIISTSINMATKSFFPEKDVFDILDEAEQTIFNIAQTGLRDSYVNIDKALSEALDYIDSVHGKAKSGFAVPSGLIEIDELLGGFQKSDLIIIAARPGMGKTAFALSVARNAAVEYNVPIAFFSLEMSRIQLVTRLISAEARIDLHKIRTGKIPNSEASKISQSVPNLAKAKFFIDDTPGQTVLEIRAKARRLKAEANIGMIIIDYLQLMNPSKNNMESREREISTISRSLKALAKELNIPVIALAQLNRAVESRHDKRPMLSDLRESGSIEQDADVVIFLYRPEVYGIETLQSGDSTEGYAEAIISKHRNGPPGTIPLQFLKQYGRFENRAITFNEIPEEGVKTSLSEEPPPAEEVF